VIQIDGDEARGSARSIPEFDVVAALDDASDWLVRYGGHARAAGFTVKTAELDRLLEHLTSAAGQAMRGVDLRPTLEIDAVARAEHVGWPLYEALAQLEPFGEANPRPLLLMHDVAISNPRVVGGSHLRFVAEAADELGSIDAIAFGAGDRASRLGSRIDLVCSLRLNKWRGRRNLELLVEDMATPH
jgi:single-stranded-DNA-specific exonuclease